MKFRMFLALAILLSPLPAIADKIPVDLELAFVVDASGSIDEEEMMLQRQGYADALRHPRILNAISSGYLRRIAVAFIEFAAYECERVSVPWAIIDGRAAAQNFSEKLAAVPYLPCLGGNAVADALVFAAESIDQNTFEGTRRVIDISGDGPNTMGRTLRSVRDAVVAKNITINALILDRPEMPDLPEYFQAAVIGGPGAFAIEVKNHQSFAAAILKKMLSEIAGNRQPGLAGLLGHQ